MAIYTATIQITLDDSKKIVRQLEIAAKSQEYGSEAETILELIIGEMLLAEAEVTADLNKDLIEVLETAECLQSLIADLNYKISERKS